MILSITRNNKELLYVISDSVLKRARTKYLLGINDIEIKPVRLRRFSNNYLQNYFHFGNYEGKRVLLIDDNPVLKLRFLP